MISRIPIVFIQRISIAPTQESAIVVVSAGRLLTPQITHYLPLFSKVGLQFFECSGHAC
jgi:hypothetical protein